MIKTKEQQPGVFTLYRNDHQLQCPYQPALALPGQLSGQIQIIRSPCSTLCPMCIVTDTWVMLECTKTEIKKEKSVIEVP